VGGVL
jgi:hypothetical protein